MGAKVSFVVAIYGVEGYIEKCVRSLCEQTMEEIEIVLVDDCTPDRSMEIAMGATKDYPGRERQMKMVRHEENCGLHQVRRSGVGVATGEYVIFVDGDDWVEADMAERMYAKAESEMADMVLSGFWWYQPKGRVYRMPVPAEALADTEAIKEATFNRRGWPNVWCRMIRREILASEKMMWPVADHPEDLVITVAATYYSKRIVYVEEPLYHYRYNQRSISNDQTSANKLRRYRDFVQNNELLSAFYEQNGLNERYSHGMIVNKSYARNELLPLAGKRKYRRMWRKSYPELNKMMLHGSSYREKIWLVAVSIGLYPRFKRLLLSKRLRPAVLWRKAV